ncbi:MAG: hypothetical protein E7523_03210 [Ruminococcaceae bacterium]|nr:hypothetical protein [Oscillospiraceae bacterium]
MFKQKATKMQTVALVFSLLIPVVDLLIMIAVSIIQHPNFLVAGMLILPPFLASIFIGLIIPSKIKTWQKVILTIILLLIVIDHAASFLLIE